MSDVVTEPLNTRKGGRPVRWALKCDVCKLQLLHGAPILFAVQTGGSGPYPGMSEWYVAGVHADPCGASLLGCYGTDYESRQCRGCAREMWVRLNTRRAHCTYACRQRDYRRRRQLDAQALARGQVMRKSELYWLTRPDPLQWVSVAALAGAS
jgi:hypothetical protein